MGACLIPLYNDKHPDSDKCPSDANTGLWYDKFCNQWSKSKDSWVLKDNGKKKWLESVQKNRKIGDGDLLAETVGRYIRLVLSLGGKIKFFRNTAPFVTGLGQSHPVETGFTWHHNLGVPYLPGSSLKGVARAWAESWWKGTADEDKSNLIWQIFGSKDENERKVGKLIFFDALPIRPVVLKTDVMTPHYTPYYQNGKNIPGDWYNPIPIPFLTMAPGQIFIFGVAPRKEMQIRDLELALNWLTESLGVMGAGAKTAVGYGCFELVPDVKHIPQSLQKFVASSGDKKSFGGFQVPELNLTPVRQEMEQDGYSDTNKEIFMKALTEKWLDRMEAEEIEISERMEIAEHLAVWYQRERHKQWKKPVGKNLEKVQRIKNVLKKFEKFE
jgi:CRISPR-associated protein Cmr6